MTYRLPDLTTDNINFEKIKFYPIIQKQAKVPDSIQDFPQRSKQKFNKFLYQYGKKQHDNNNQINLNLPRQKQPTRFKTLDDNLENSKEEIKGDQKFILHNTQIRSIISQQKTEQVQNNRFFSSNISKRYKFCYKQGQKQNEKETHTEREQPREKIFSPRLNLSTMDNRLCDQNLSLLTIDQTSIKKRQNTLDNSLLQISSKNNISFQTQRSQCLIRIQRKPQAFSQLNSFKPFKIIKLTPNLKIDLSEQNCKICCKLMYQNMVYSSCCKYAIHASCLNAGDINCKICEHRFQKIEKKYIYKFQNVKQWPLQGNDKEKQILANWIQNQALQEANSQFHGGDKKVYENWNHFKSLIGSSNLFHEGHGQDYWNCFECPRIYIYALEMILKLLKI